MKKFLTVSVALIISLFFVVASAWSAGGGHGASGPGREFVFVLINFALLLMVLYFALRRPAKEFFAARALKIQQHIDESKNLHDEAYRALEEIECKLKNVDVEGKEFLATVKDQAEQEKQSIIAQARDMAEKLKSDTDRKIQGELLRAKMELKAEAAQLASQLAAKEIKDNISADDQVRLGAEFIKRIKTAGLS